MAVNDKRRQKKLERKKQQRRHRHRELARSKSRSIAEVLSDAARSPILHTRQSETMFDQGMGWVLVSRKLPDGQIAVGVFLLDTYCLGVKDVFGIVVTPGEYKERFVEGMGDTEMIDIPPAEARKIVEEAAAYGEHCGVSPPSALRRIMPIFGDIDASECEKNFEFGDEGKPHFISGPHDSPQRCRQIKSVLHEQFGTDGYHYTMAILAEEVNKMGHIED